MTENEKLRALLAEARDYIGHTSACALYDVPPSACDCLTKHIDAALAEPVVPEYTFRGGYIEDASGDRWWSAELLAKTERERDEARAEVEVLRGVGCQTADKAGEEPSGPCGVCRKCAHQRGAEAMREAAASCVGSDTALLQTYRSVLEGRIRDLPVPEDKP